MSDLDLIDLLHCPRCDAPLSRDNEHLRCSGCDTTYPLLDGIPFLFAEPGVALDEWRGRYHARLRQVEQEIGRLQETLTRDDLHALTRQRIEGGVSALTAHIDELKALLEPLDVTHLTADHTTYLALRTRLPEDQGLETYYANLHRDWCWGDEENAHSLALVQAALTGHNVGRLLVLGAGGARLAYDLHRAASPELTVALDLSPILLLTAKHVAAGETVALTEFPIAPRDMASAAVPRKLSAPEPAGPGFELVLANALRPPFKPGSFNTLLTPWLADVIGASLSDQAARWNQLLQMGGQWVWFGSHAFRDADPAECLSIEESAAIIADAGFSEPEITEAEIPYMVSPASRHGRRERVVVMRMTKTADVAAPARHVALPDWLVKSDLPVPSAEYYQVQAAQTRIHAFFMALVDGQRSIGDMARLMEEQRLMPAAEAEGTIRNFLIRMYEDSRGYSTF
ncbi:MAG: hypothetical protein AAFY69_04325 [Pseudomonadota bacterium]